MRVFGAVITMPQLMHEETTKNEKNGNRKGREEAFYCARNEGK